MILSTTDSIIGKEVKETLGLVKGATVQSKHLGRDLMASLKTIVGGEIKGYTEMLKEAREIATNRMIEEAKTLGADAIVGIRYGTSEALPGAAEILAYGTAVKLK
jgi:uncharacterized protein YbjQ (UPF0145 family)